MTLTKTQLIKLRRDVEYTAKMVGELTRYPINCQAVLKILDHVDEQEKRIAELEAALNDAAVIVDYYRQYEFNAKVNNPAIFTDSGYYNLSDFLNSTYTLLEGKTS